MKASKNNMYPHTSLSGTPATNAGQRKHRLRRVLMLVLGVACLALGGGQSAAAPSAAPTVPWPYVPETVNSWVYEEMERQFLLGNVEQIHGTARPISRVLIAARVAEALARGEASPGLQRLAREFAWEIQAMDRTQPDPQTAPFWTIGPQESQVIFHWLLETTGKIEQDVSPDWNASRLGAAGTYWSPGSFSLFGDYTITGVKNAERFGNHVSGDFTLLTPRFGAYWHGSFAQVWFSRERVRWGPGRSGGLLTGGGSDAFVNLGYRIHVGHSITASSHHGWLSAAEGKYVAFHRVEGYLGPFVLAMAEGVRYNANSPDPLYLLNLIPYSAAERTASKDGRVKTSAARDSLFRSNYMLSTDITWYLHEGSAVYGEFLLDDYFVDGGQPQRIGYQLGAVHAWGDIKRSWSLQGEYTRVFNYVYSTFYQADFEHAGDPLGYPRGPDVEAVDFWLDVDTGPVWQGRLHAFLQNRGEGRLGEPWCPERLEDSEDVDHCRVFGDTSARDFQGVVEQALGFLAGPVWAPRDNVYCEVFAGLVAYRNFKHRAGDNPTHLIANLSLKFRW